MKDTISNANATKATTAALPESNDKRSVTPTPEVSVSNRKQPETVLQIDPSSSRGPSQKLAHLHGSPYVHHFDTFTLVRDLEKKGFTQEQSVTIMKAVRSLLAVNLDMAREGLVSKSDIENVTFPGPSILPTLASDIENAHNGP